MADKRNQWADPLAANHSGWLTGFLAEENRIDRRMLWRLGSWGVAAVGAVVVAVLASQSQIQLRRDQFATSDMLARQAQQIQSITRDTQTENRRLLLAIETLSGDRDRLYTRVTAMEQGLEAATGSIKRQVQASVAPAAPTPAPSPAVTAPSPAPATVADAAPKPTAELPTIPSALAPVIGSVASKAPVETPPDPPAPALPATVSESTTPALMAWKSMMGPMSPKDGAAVKPAESAASTPSPAAPETTASVSPMNPAPAAASMSTPEGLTTPVARTEFGVDIGGANSVDGLRAIWRGVAKSKPLDGLRPIMMVKERGTGLGMQLRLIAGPVTDAAAAAKICAALTESGRPCETTVFDGQRLALKSESAPAAVTASPPKAAALPAATPAAPPAGTVTQRPLKPIAHRRAAPKPEQRQEPAAPKPVEETAAPPPKPQSSLTTFLGVN
ncbi:MAG: hypothetical protein ABWY18_07920 [Tardiphaga sp.]